jgi:hypothetical protein
MLEFVKIKKLHLLPGCCLGQYENAMAEDAAVVEMLHGSCATKDDGWLQNCYLEKLAMQPKAIDQHQPELRTVVASDARKKNSAKFH